MAAIFKKNKVTFEKLMSRLIVACVADLDDQFIDEIVKQKPITWKSFLNLDNSSNISPVRSTLQMSNSTTPINLKEIKSRAKFILVVSTTCTVIKRKFRFLCWFLRYMSGKIMLVLRPTLQLF